MSAEANLHHELARCRSELGVIGWRLITLLAIRAQAQEEFTEQKIKAKDYAKAVGISSHSVYERLEKAVGNLRKASIEISNNGFSDKEKFKVVKIAEYQNNEGEMTLCFHEEMKPLILFLKNHFTVKKETIFALRSLPSIRFYMLCKSYFSLRRHGWAMTVKQLRQWLDCETKFRTSHDIKHHVIGRSKMDLDRYSELSFEFESIRQGREMAGWLFKIKETQTNEAEFNQLTNNLQWARDQWDAADTEQRNRWMELLEIDVILRPMEPEKPNKIILQQLFPLLKETHT